MNDFGECIRCGAPAVVEINDRPACEDHLDEVMGEAFDHVRRHIWALGRPR